MPIHALIFILFSSIQLLNAEERASNLSLKDAITKLKNQNLELLAEKFKTQIAAGDKSLISGEFLPKISLSLGAGPINGKSGNVLSYTNTNSWGAILVSSIEAKIPLFVWNRSGDLYRAVEANVQVNQQDQIKKENEIIVKLKEAYYGEQFALSLYDFVTETEKDLTDALTALESKKSKKEEMLRIEVLKFQVQEKKAEIEKSIKLARMGVQFFTGTPVKENLSLNERQWIERDERELKPLDYYLAKFNQHHPDLQKVKYGILAKEALHSSEKKSQYPTIGALVKYDYAHTNQRTAQNNPFAYDPYNKNDLALGIGLSLDLDFGVKKSKIDKLSLEVLELKAKKEFAETGLSVLVQKAYLEVKEAEERAIALNKAYKAAKKWMTTVGASVALGLTPAKDIVDAYTTKAFIFKDYYESIYRYQMAWAKLSEACGVEVDPSLE